MSDCCIGVNIILNMLDINTVSFKAEVQVSPTFLGWTISFGEKLKVISPINIVDEVKNYLEKMRKLYNN